MKNALLLKTEAKIQSKEQMSEMLVVNTTGDLSGVLNFGTEDAIDYNPQTSLDSEGGPRCYKIENFPEREFFPDFLRGFSLSDFRQGKSKDINFAKNSPKIDYLLKYSEDGEESGSAEKKKQNFYFQRFTPSQLVKETLLSLSGEFSLKKEGVIIVQPLADAYYNAENETFYFRDQTLGKVKKIIPGIEMLYAEATKEQIEKFVKNELFSFEYDAENIGVANKKRIALVCEKLDSMNDNDKSAVISYAKKYQKRLFNADGKITIAKEEDLKQVYYLLDERFHTTEIGKKRRVANSVISLD